MNPIFCRHGQALFPFELLPQKQPFSNPNPWLRYRQESLCIQHMLTAVVSSRGLLWQIGDCEEKLMTLIDISNGPAWIIWIEGILFAIISIILISGHGANLIAGYNTASREEKNRYDTKKLCRGVGIGMSLITLMIFIMAIWETVLPAYFSTVFLVITVVDCTTIIVLSNTICKK